MIIRKSSIRYIFCILGVITTIQFVVYFNYSQSIKLSDASNVNEITPNYSNFSFDSRSENCKKEFNNYFLAEKSMKFFNYCPLYYKTNVPVTFLLKSSFNEILSSHFITFNVSSKDTLNALDNCGSYCRNTAHTYMALKNSICYCFNKFVYSKPEIRDSCSVFATGAVPITYKTPSFAKTNKSVVVAYLLMLNGRDVLSLSRLFRVIYSKKDLFFIHIDKRQTFLFNFANNMRRENVIVFDWSLPTIWGGASLLTAYRRAMKNIIAMNLSWDFLINLSESDYLIRPKKELDEFLAANKERNFVKSSGQSVKKFIDKQALNKAFIECDEHLHLLEERPLPHNLIIDGGSDWFALSHSFVHYVATSNDRLIDNLFLFFRNSLLPAETFFHTALQNSRFCGSVINSNLRFTNWNRARGCRCQHSSVIGWCGCSPSVLRKKDLRMLETVIDYDRSIFFARKFDPVVDIALQDAIDKNMHRFQSLWRAGKPFRHIVNFYDQRQDADTYLPLAALLLRLARDNGTESGDCSFPISSDSGVSLYLAFHSSHASPNVMLFLRHAKATLEALFTHTGQSDSSHRLSTPSHPLYNRLLSLQVSSNYDVKENIFRTPAFLLTPLSFLTLEIKIVPGSSDPPLDLSVTFVDPNTSKISFHLPQPNEHNRFTEGTTVSSIWYEGFDIPRPLVRGRWQVILYAEGFKQPLMETFFFVQPSEDNWQMLEARVHGCGRRQEVRRMLEGVTE